MWDFYEATVSACAVGVGGRQWQREHPLDTAAEQRDADGAEADGEHRQQRARVLEHVESEQHKREPAPPAQALAAAASTRERRHRQPLSGGWWRWWPARTAVAS